MRHNHIIHMAHLIIKDHAKPDHVAVDMTMGNGHDTIFLAQLFKHVYAFDIQEQALIKTQDKLESNHISNVTLIKDSHANIKDYIQSFDTVIYNLGYLPSGDKTITTHHESTLQSLKDALALLNPGGLILMVIYPGHPEGKVESNHLNTYFKTLDSNTYKLLKTDLPYQDNHPPYIISIYKKELNV